MYLESHAADIRVVHFLGVKPWACTRLRDCNTHNANYAHTQQMWARSSFRAIFFVSDARFRHAIWWREFDGMCAAGHVACEEQRGSFAVK